MKQLQRKITPKGRNKTGYETYRDIKLRLRNKLQTRTLLCRRIADCRLEDSVAVDTVGQKREYEAHGRNTTHWPTTRETQTI